VDFQVAGEGAMGLVYLALDTELNRNVAFKIVRPDAGAERPGDTPGTPLDASAPSPEQAIDRRFAELRARFLQEAWVTGGMEHPGIVPVYELGQTEGGVPYYTMRFVRGRRTLETAIEQLEGGAFEERLTVLEPFLKLCDAVSYAHAKGVIHRDLKPANVALGEFGEVVVLDWGLAKLHARDASSESETAVLRQSDRGFQTDATGLGTPGYMAPEAVRGGMEDLDVRSDVYSLGVILFQILTGRLPFPVDPFPAYLRDVTTSDPPSSRSVNDAVPAALDRLCTEALSRERDGRLPSVRTLADGVRHWQTQSALEREMDGLLRDAKTALSAAADSKGPSRIRQTQRALEILATARRRRPDSPRLQRLQSEARALHDRGIKETQRLSRRRIALVGGATLLVLISIAAFVVAGLLNERRKEAEDANRATQAALAEATKQREAAHRESVAAQEARAVAVLRAEEATNAYELVSAFLSQLQDAEAEGAGRLSEVRDAGIDAALTRGDAVGVFFLLEQARDARRFARLDLGAALQDVAVPPDLDAAERASRRRTGEAHRSFRDARRRAMLQEVRSTKRALDAAQEEHARALDAVLEALEDRADADLPGTAMLAQVQSTLSPDDVFVSYGRVKDTAVAVVIRQATKWVVSLAEQERIDDAVSALRKAIETRRNVTQPVRDLRELVVRPLALPPTGGRIVLVPRGATMLVPFPLLLPGREVYVIPSAGAYLHLLALPTSQAEGVLAVADPILERSPAIPGARAEAESVGTTKLLGADATWAKLLDALSSRSTWRAVHIGCEGRLAGDEPNSGFLRLTPEDTDDGILGVREVTRLDGRADLVVMSTASIRRSPADLDGETLDVPQAWMFAGAQRVLFPIHDPHDEATRALMVKFYELWHPGDGSEGAPVMDALQRAQAHVRNREEWSAPYYWAGWVLWGLP
jgi:serine/threonine protein kinase/CHAT domain-containing protein